MSLSLISFAKKFVDGDISAEAFVDPYIAKWSDERDANKLKDDTDNVSECASSSYWRIATILTLIAGKASWTKRV